MNKENYSIQKTPYYEGNYRFGEKLKKDPLFDEGEHYQKEYKRYPLQTVTNKSNYLELPTISLEHPKYTRSDFVRRDWPEENQSKVRFANTNPISSPLILRKENDQEENSNEALHLTDEDFRGLETASMIPRPKHHPHIISMPALNESNHQLGSKHESLLTPPASNTSSDNEIQKLKMKNEELAKLLEETKKSLSN